MHDMLWAKVGQKIEFSEKNTHKIMDAKHQYMANPLKKIVNCDSTTQVINNIFLYLEFYLQELCLS